MSQTVSEKAQTDWKFLARFAIYLGFFVGLVQVPQFRYTAFSRLTAWTTAVFWNLLGIPASSADTCITFYDFTMEIIFECTGMHYIGIFAAGISAYSGRAVKKKISGLLIGIVLILLLNTLRLGLLGITGHFFPDIFQFLHLYFWHGLFTLFVLLLWLFWIQGKISVSWLPAKTVRVVFLSAFLSFFLLWANLDHYFSFLAVMADTLFPLLRAAVSVPDSVFAEGALIGYLSGEYVIYSRTGLYTLNLAVFIALDAAGFLSARPGIRLKRTLFGIFLMIIHHLVLLFLDFSIEMAESDVMNSVLRWSIILSSMTAPVLIWLCVLLMFPAEQARTPGR